MHCSMGGLRSRHKVVFENQECLKFFGRPRTYEDHDLHMSTFPEDFQRTRRSWLSKVAMVQCCFSAVHCYLLSLALLLAASDRK